MLTLFMGRCRFFLLAFSFFSLVSCAKLDDIFENKNRESSYRFENENNYCISYTKCVNTNHYDVIGFYSYMSQNSGAVSVQGCASYNDYMFQFQNGFSKVYIYNLRDKRFERSIEFTANSFYHCNNATFSSVFFSSNDLFPLLYISQQNNSQHKTVVCRLEGDCIDNLVFKIVQTIIGPVPSDDNHLYYQDSIVDPENSDYYIYAHHKRDDVDSIHIVQFKLPRITKSEIQLREKDAIASICYDNQFSSPQGGVSSNGKLYIIKGVPGWSEHVYLDIVDFKAKEVSSIDLSDKGFKNEPEGLCFYNNQLLCATNHNKGVFLLTINTNDNES